MSIDRHDGEVHPRCPPLGGEVPFRHCRQVNDGLPCHRVVVCWQGRLEIASFLREHYRAEEIEAMSRPPRSRLEVIIGAVERVRGRPGDADPAAPLNPRREESDTES